MKLEALDLETTLTRFAERADAEGEVDVAYGTMDAPLGELLVAATEQGVVYVGFDGECDATLSALARSVSPRLLRLPRRVDAARRELDEYFNGERREFTVPLDRSHIGPFCTRVLERTASIPYGEVLAYSEVALEVGAPRAARAVGNALGANPIPVIIPCHRVVRTGGALGGYGGGLERKRLLLELEGALPSLLTNPAVARSG
jgi:methylated-DNA-[protein]-cysteine S-methyltransferase